MKELIKRVEAEINKTPTGELRNLLCDVNIVLQTKEENFNIQSIERLQEAMPKGTTILIVDTKTAEAKKTMTIEESLQQDQSFPITELLKASNVEKYYYTKEELQDKPSKHRNKRPYHK